MINFLQWNINGANRKKASLLHTIHTDHLDIIVLQETLIRDIDKYKISGFKTFGTPQNDLDRGLIRKI